MKRIPAPEIKIFSDLEALSRAAASEFAALAARNRPAGKLFSAALSGGSTPRRFYELVASPEFSKRVPWGGVHLFQVDERCVPPDDPESNYRMMREAMLGSIDLPSANFHRMQGEEHDHEQAARLYENDLRKVLHVPAPAWPKLDVAYLGLGDDGHTASLFPGTLALEEGQLAVCANYVPRFKMFRLTLTFPVLNAAAKLIFLVSGPGKAEIVRQVLKPPSQDSSRFPALRIQPPQGTVSWYLDQAAASLL